MLSAFFVEDVPILYVERFGFKTVMLLSNIWHTSHLLNMLWVPPPCASRKGVKRLQLCQLFSVGEKRERIPIPFQAVQRNTI